MTSTLTSRRASSTISAQDLLKLPGAASKSGFLRVKGSRFAVMEVWTRKFIILTKDNLYVYDEELSKSPTSVVNLIGYNRLKRQTAKKYEWVFEIQSAFESVKTITLAATSHQDRYDWMRAVKRHLYMVNGIPEPEGSSAESMNEEFEYSHLENTLFEPEESLSTPSASAVGSRMNSLEVNDDPIEAQYDDGESLRPTEIPTVSPSVPSEEELGEHEYEESVERKQLSSQSMNPHRTCSEPCSKSAPLLPPRRTASEHEPSYYNEDRQSEDDAETPDKAKKDKAKSHAKTMSLEEGCTLDPSMVNRDEIIKLLQEKKAIGTYIIRKSRKGDSKVLMILSTNQEVKEYKILEMQGKFRLDKTADFSTIEDLLKAYKSRYQLPNSDHYLVSGFYEMDDDLDEYDFIA